MCQGVDGLWLSEQLRIKGFAAWQVVDSAEERFGIGLRVGFKIFDS